MKFEAGSTAFTRDGREVEFIAENCGEHIVRSIMNSEDGEPRYGSVFAVRELYTDIPEHKFNEQILKLQEELKSLTLQKAALDKDLREAKDRQKELTSIAMVNSALTRINDFLAGKITHIVHNYGGWKIETFDEDLKYKNSDYDKVPTAIRLLTLFGESGGDLEWRLSAYRDGSGSTTTVYPCTSLEEARQLASDKLQLSYDEWRKSPSTYRWIAGVVGNSETLGLDVPEDARVAVDNETSKRLLEERDEAKRKLETAESNLAAGTWLDRKAKR